MNTKDLLVVMVLALVTTWSVDYFFYGRKPFQRTSESGQSGQQFHVPEQKRELSPLNREIDFICTERSQPAECYTVETEYASYVFSTDGGSIDCVTFKEVRDGATIELNTIHSEDDTNRTQRCFLLALNEKTPYFYTLHEHRDLDDQVIVSYKAETPEVSVLKTFTISKLTYRIDVAIALTPKKGEIKPRLVFPSPFMRAIQEHDKLSAVMSNQQGGVDIEKTLKNLDETGWFEPTLFGTANKYFVHAMVKDEGNFAHRAYYSQLGNEQLLTFLEGPTISEPTTWNLSFYLGPKTEEAMSPVDPRLEKTLDYAGLLTPISQALLKLMKLLHYYLHNYGLVIIAITALLKLILLPFTIGGDKKAKEHAEFQRKMAYIQKKYKDDQERLKEEQAALIKKYGLPGLQRMFADVHSVADILCIKSDFGQFIASL